MQSMKLEIVTMREGYGESHFWQLARLVWCQPLGLSEFTALFLDKIYLVLMVSHHLLD